MSQPRRWSRDRVIRSLVERCGLPEGATVEKGRFGGLSYVDNGLIRRLHIGVPKHRPGAISWSVQVGDEALERPNDVAFATRYHIDDALIGGAVRRTDSRNWTDYPWPVVDADIDSHLIGDIRRFAPTMLWFLADRHALGLMLLHGDDDSTASVTRDGVEARRWTGGSNGVVRAVILARRMGDAALESLALAKLDRLRDRPENAPDGPTFGELVGHWARTSVAWSPVDISDLAAIAWPRRRKR